MNENLLPQELIVNEVSELFPGGLLNVIDYLEYLRNNDINKGDIRRIISVLNLTTQFSEELIIKITKLLISEETNIGDESIINIFHNIVEALGSKCNVYKIQMSDAYNIKSHINKWAVSLQEDIIAINRELRDEFNIIMLEFMH